MFLQPYRRVLALPRVRTAVLLMGFARLPLTIMGISLTLHVVTELGRGYGAAGLAGTGMLCRQRPVALLPRTARTAEADGPA